MTSTKFSDRTSSPSGAGFHSEAPPLGQPRLGFGEIMSLLRALDGTGRKELVLVLVSIMAVGLTESFGILLLVPLLALLGLDTTGGFSSAIMTVVAAPFGWLGIRPTLSTVLGLYVIVVGVRSLVQWYEGIASERLAQRFMHDLRTSVYRGVARIPWVDFARCRTSGFTHAMTNEIERAGVATSLLVRLIVDFVFAMLYLILALVLSAPLTLVATGLGFVLLAALHGWNARVRAQGERLSQLWLEMHLAIGQDLRGMKTIRSYGAEERSASHVLSLSSDVSRTHVKTRSAHASAAAIFALGSAVILALIVLLAVQKWSLAPGLVLMLIYLYARLVPRFSALQEDYRRLSGEFPAIAGIFGLISWCEERQRQLPAEATPINLEREIRLCGVSYAYQETTVLRDVDVTLKAGTTIAIAGRSGSGKTTLADLVAGLLEPSEGEVLIDGEVLTPERAQGWRHRIAYVTQETFLLHDTIRANLLWASPDASDEDLARALSLAGVASTDPTARLALDAIVGDQGMLLSGGERQRVALARAILRKPSLLILDEPTSALDLESERAILRAIGVLHGAMTILLVTHRIQAMADADVILVLDQGSVVESGSWRELIGDPGSHFHKLNESQWGEENGNKDELLQPAAFQQ